MLALISEAIKKCFEPAINFEAPYAKAMLDMASKEVLKELQSLSIETFDTATEALVWSKIINKIAK